MHIKAKLYPYPVLANFNDDYVDSKFNIFVIIQSFPNELLIQFKPELNNAGIKTLIDNNSASCYVHIECSLTSYRKIVKVPLEGLEYSIPADSIEGPISFCPFVIANQDIPNYTNEKLNKDYDGATFDLEKGNILAIGQEVQTRVEKENDDLANVPSIFAVTEIKDPERKDIVIDNAGNKINVQLPSETFFEFKIAMANPNSMSVLHSMVIIPALMKCFEDMKSKPEEFYTFEDRRWFRALKKAMKKINIDLTEENIMSIDSFTVAQKLMDNTTNRAILKINDIAYKGDINDD